MPATSPFKLFLNYRNNLFMLHKNLASTFALKYLKEGSDIDEAVGKGMRKAGSRIFARKCLDLMSAAVYLMTLKTDCFKAVLRAHKEVRKACIQVSPGDIRKLLEKHGDAEINGIYRKWIVLSQVKEKDICRI